MNEIKVGRKKLEQLKKMPWIQNSVFKTEDGKFIVHKTTISSIKPVEYYEAILNNEQED